ncbi:ATP-dependent DNA helicase PIF1 [Ooceraea biroi]|uniref:ATP-dependent DNA helicase PIF1 n=1 Tax=Ooceraea biroi TaxID=2015173 RepID=A0A026WHD3_OOCBI|nr:ATP-dependent DNA helicase PIF1 [Ooceraea biroi]
MLHRIASDEIELVAQDITDCHISYLKKKVSKILNKDDEDSSRTAGLARIIIVKLGARIMIRRNIDVTLGLVNGTIGTITSFIRNNNNVVDKIKIMLTSGIEHVLERVSVKFEVMNGAYVITKQFPICLSYGMTIHKSQGLSLKHAIVETGNSVFSCGQIYVALSQVTTLNGLQLVNYDPSSVKANELAIIEYNRLRSQYRPDLLNINISKQYMQKVPDLIWAMSKNILECQIKNTDDIDNTLWCIRGLPNIDNVSCYANASLQCIFHSSTLRTSLLRLQHTNVMRKLLDYYANNKTINIITLRQLASDGYLSNFQQDVAEFITHLCCNIDNIKTEVEHYLKITL